ncbi:NUDIX domain-containing protein [Microlunatus parietis]|uniref:8-oxo-dGTP pyrophosphatase MutT (NUDIX family) n=1 Tax=Microlunatus parietis TaxID=682979 RepID=A0A7Y9I1X1_9ACTN|nr:NUDIX hydrolase [Microlunatus parietis]NYE68678.1 8-oxo-dGTP pyrophosphatase MutT (NUDIX family) [Microlunatus parietis]
MPTIEPPPGHWSLKLPRKREASGALFFDEHARVLIVDPTYVEGWDYPGGIVEPGEAPYAAACREIREELGLTKQLGQLIAVDWEPRTTNIPIEGLTTVFDGGVLSPEEIASILLPPNELKAYNWCRVDQLDERLPAPYARRIRAAVDARAEGRVAYLENGFPVPAGE